MIHLNKCRVKIKFQFGKCNNKFFSVTIKENNKSFDVLPFETDNKIIGVFENTIFLPTKIVITACGKDNSVDTKLDENFNIIEDLFVQITNISLDDFELHQNFLYKKIILNTVENKKIVSNYIGFNGEIELDFKQNNVFLQYLDSNLHPDLPLSKEDPIS